MQSIRLRADLAVIGGGVGGCAAALAAADAGVTVVLANDSPWIGGQLTAQMVPPDEHGWIERFGRTRSYQEFRQRVREYYRTRYPLTAAAKADAFLNPGNGWVSPLCHEPRVALAVLEGMLENHRSSGRLKILRGVVPREVRCDGDTIVSVSLTGAGGVVQVIEARFFVDATELGELLELGEIEHVTGRESREESGEPSASAVAQPQNVQAFSWCFAIEHHEGKDFSGPPPRDYDYWRRYVPSLQPAWPGPLLSWTGVSPRTMKPVSYRFEPHREEPAKMSGLWSYRRILDRSQFQPGFLASDIVVVNWPMIDYLPRSLLSPHAAERKEAAEGARQLSFAVLHWLQTEAPRSDGGRGWSGIRLSRESAGTADGLALSPYIRESRRVRAECTVREQDVSKDSRPGDRLGERYTDSVGIGSYRIDLHPSTGGDNFVDVAALPFRIPLGALIPLRVENLLAGAKNIGTTHITNGCYRLHPVEWNVGEAAGTLVAFCISEKCTPRAVRREQTRLRRYQDLLAARGVELAWPENLDLAAGDPHAHVLRDLQRQGQHQV
jgi:hypothetical protein